MSKKGLFFVLSVLKRKRSSRVLIRSLYILLCFSCYGNENSKPSQKIYIYSKYTYKQHNAKHYAKTIC